MSQRLRDRTEAGRLLAERLSHLAGRADVLVLGLPRGGVPVAHEVAAAIGAPLDVLTVCKLGVPGHEELAMGAVASGGHRVLNRDVLDGLALDAGTIDAVSARGFEELRRRELAYRGDRPPLEIAGRTLVLVDDGLATGATMRAAVAALRAGRPSGPESGEAGAARIVVAVPVAPPDVCRQLEAEADEVVCLMTPHPFTAVGLWYHDFGPTPDDVIRRVLRGEDGR